MIEQASNVRKHLGRFLTTDPGRFAGSSAVSDPFGLLAVEREHLTVPRSPQHEGSPQAAAPAEQSTQPDPSGDVTGPTESRTAGRYRRPGNRGCPGAIAAEGVAAAGGVLAG